MKCPESYRAGPYWYMQVKVIEEYVCPKCDEIHRIERQRNDERTRGSVECPSCGFTKTI
jgi:predicted RNA-binding Zn-ribbon protein involved in translation (DUF1610 family)